MSSKVVRNFQLTAVVLALLDIIVYIGLGTNVSFCFDLLGMSNNYNRFEETELTFNYLLFFIIPYIIRFIIYLSFLLVTKRAKIDKYKMIGIIFLVLDIVAMALQKPLYDMEKLRIFANSETLDIYILFNHVEACAGYVEIVTYPICKGLFFAACGIMMAVRPKEKKQETVDITEIAES